MPAARGRDAAAMLRRPGRRVDGRRRAGGVRPRRRLPRPDPGRGGPRQCRLRGGGGRVPLPLGGAGRRGAARRHRPRAHRDDHQHRGSGHPPGPEAGVARASAGPTGWWPPSSPTASVADLGVSSAAELWDEIERLAPSPRRDHPDRPRHPGGARRHHRPVARRPRCAITARRAPGTVRPHGHARHRRRRSPGRAAPRRPGRAPGGDELRRRRRRHRNGASGANGADGDTARRRRAAGRCAGPCPSTCPTCPRPTATRCGSCRRGGSTTAACCSRRAASLAPLAPAATVRANPHDLEQLGRRRRRRGCGCARRGPRSTSRPWPTTACPAGWSPSTSTSHGDDPGAGRRAPVPRR